MSKGTIVAAEPDSDYEGGGVPNGGVSRPEDDDNDDLQRLVRQQSPDAEDDQGEGDDVFEFFDIETSLGKSSGRQGQQLQQHGGTAFSWMAKPSDELNASIDNITSSLQRKLSEELNRSCSRKSRSSAQHDELNNSLGNVPKVTPTTNEQIDTKYYVDYSSEIARGTKTVVRKCMDRKTGKRCAVKIVRRTDQLEYNNMLSEANLLTGLDHPSIVKLYDIYKDLTYLYLVLELCKGGDVFDHVTAKPAKKENQNIGCLEKFTAVVAFKVVDAVAYLHEQNIVHRDLKLENIKKKEAACANVRLIDFGLSRRYNMHHGFDSLKKLTSFVGTKYYVAPEVLNKSYTHAVDLWSIGPTFFSAQKRPSREETTKNFLIAFNIDVSDDAKHFIKILLVKDESLRPRAHELLGHPWMVRAWHWQVEMRKEEDINRSRSIF
ncbi:LOW QUALITY PROTEIN: hypothetical protein ACHAWF_012062 [Thalassiosira exigua]